MTDYNALAAQFARRFIQRRDVKAIQFDSGGYSPDRELRNLGHYAPLGWDMPHLWQHLQGQVTYGHYLIDADDMARCFCLDIDLKKNIPDKFTGYYVDFEQQASAGEQVAPIPFDPREAWLDRGHPSRPWTKYQFGMLARKLTATINKELGLGAVAAYSGNKGIHVYGFTGPMPAEQVRAAALFVLEASDDWEIERGSSLFRFKLQDPDLGFPNVNLEVYPKQDSLKDKDLGNLLRLPLGVNRKNPADPTFFMDLRTPVGVLAPHPDPVRLLETGNSYE